MIGARLARRLVIGVVGYPFLLFAVVAMISPIPLGPILVPLALVFLSLEFKWADRLVRTLERKAGPLGRGVAGARRRVRRLGLGVEHRLRRSATARAGRRAARAAAADGRGGGESRPG